MMSISGISNPVPAAAACSKLVVLKENVHGSLRSGRRLDPKLQDDGFEVTDPPRDAVLDNVDFAGKKLINHVNDRLKNGVHIMDRFLEKALQGQPEGSRLGEFITANWQNTHAAY